VSKGIKIAIFSTVMIGMVIIFAIFDSSNYAIEKRYKNKMNSAFELILKGEYVEAQTQFIRIMDETSGERRNMAEDGCFFSIACRYYAEKNYRAAYGGLDNNSFESILTEENQKEYAKIVDRITENYLAHKAEYDEEDRKSKERSDQMRKEEEERKKKREAEENAKKQQNKTNGGSGRSYTRPSKSTVDPSDHDIEQYYLDYEDEFEDNEEYWDEY